MNCSALLAICSVCTVSLAAVQVEICNPDTLEPYCGTDVMTGSRLSIVVSSDSTSLWSGGIFIENTQRDYGTLLGRTKDPNSRDWMDSHLSTAGDGAQVLEWKDSVRWGFDLYTDDLQRQNGKWFVVDYEAVKPGSCEVFFYDYCRSWTVSDPNQSIVFHNIPTRDLVADGIVNYADFSIFSSEWLLCTGISDPNLLSPADFNTDGCVDMVDVCLFADYWMYGTSGWEPKHNDPVPPPQHETEPNIVYSIYDANTLSEITLAVGQSVTLYIHQTSNGEAVHVIDLEVFVSDPNLGWIDNTPIDPNNPPGPGTARLLFEPRCYAFDYWGPGWMKPEGIEFIGADLSAKVQDGAIASFVYTAGAEGAVELDLIDHVSFSKNNKIVIHQISDLFAMQSSSPDSSTSGETDTIATAETFPETAASSTASSLPESSNPEELAVFLEDLYQQDPQIQQAVDETSWNEFVESVRNSQE